MATVRDYFETEIQLSCELAAWDGLDNEGKKLHSIPLKLFSDFYENIKYWAFFIPEGVSLDCLPFLLNSPLTIKGALEPLQILVSQCDADGCAVSTSETLVFNKRVIFYIDAFLDIEKKKEIANLGIKCGFSVLVRDKNYVAKKLSQEKPLVFISHDFQDKDFIARPLAVELSRLLGSASVWFDEYSLKPGDSLRTSIEKGLKEAKKCVIVVSPNFLSNKRYAAVEFDTIFTREIMENRNIIVPVWHDVTKKDVYDYCPSLADKVALKSSMGIEALAIELLKVVKS